MAPTETPSAHVDGTLARYRELQTQFERLRDRLRRAEEHKTTVSRRTFDKVRAEYDRELDALRAQMTPLRADLESQRASVETKLREANDSLESIEEEMAEVVFRHRVGEYSDATLAERSRSLESRLEAARARISEQRQTLNLLDAMNSDHSAQRPEGWADAPVVAPRETPREPVARESAAAAAKDPRGRPAPAPSAPSRPAPDASADEVAPPRRPTLRVKDVEAPRASAPLEARAETAPSSSETRERQPSSDFENPHDWIKEIKRDAPAPTRTSPAADAARARPSAPPAGKAGAAPTRRAAPSLVFVSGAHAGESVPLLPTTLSIGREHDNNVELKDPDVARYHARIVHERGHYVVEDLDSTTGTWVNGKRTRRATLNHGDVLRVGSTEIAIDFEWASDPV